MQRQQANVRFFRFFVSANRNDPSALYRRPPGSDNSQNEHLLQGRPLAARENGEIQQAARKRKKERQNL
ncbi:MAG: hypothetical protein IJB22_05935, partial [Clostridia bacterium]|nr:hypothetical protein [Clostridia bacterium]